MSWGAHTELDLLNIALARTERALMEGRDRERTPNASQAAFSSFPRLSLASCPSMSASAPEGGSVVQLRPTVDGHTEPPTLGSAA